MTQGKAQTVMAKARRRLAIVNTRVTPLYADLAAEIGVNESLLLVQLDFLVGLAEKDPDHHHDGQYWTYQSVTDLQEYFPFMGRATIQRTIESLVKLGLIETTDRYNRRNGDKTRWFAINYDACERLRSLGVKDRSKTEQAVPKRNRPFQNGTAPFQNGTTLPETTPETTQRIPPTPQRGDAAPPTPSGDAPGPAVVEEMATEKNDPTPPTPSPRADTVDNAVVLDLRSRRKEKEALRSTGWHEYPDRLQRIRDGLEKGWTRKNPARFDRKALEMVARSVAPDEADRFEKKTVAYLKSVDDPQYLLSLRRWLEEWREREPERDRPMNQAEINSAWLLAMKPITREEIAQ